MELSKGALLPLFCFVCRPTLMIFYWDYLPRRRNTFVGQTNNVLGFFNKLNTIVKPKLLKSYCSSIYGAELWALDSANIETFCVAWRKALRRILLYNSQSYFLPSLSDSLPVYDKICKRSMKFIATTLVSSINMLVQSIANYCVMFGRYSSFIGTNALLCCDRYKWSLSELISNPEHIKYFSFMWLHSYRDGQLCLPPLFFYSQQLVWLIDCLCTSWLYALFWVLCNFFMSVYILLVLDLCTWSTNKYNNN